jgi:transposase
MERYTIADFNRDFPNDDTCLEWLKNHLYPNGIFCIKCGQVTKHHRITTRRSYSCDVCGHHVHPTSRTIFEHSPTPLKLWFHAIYLMSSTRCGISAKQIERETGVTYKTAWRMFHEIRSLLQEKPRLTSGEFEIDETYIGGRRAGKRGRGAAGKTPVLGIVRRKGRVSASIHKDVRGSTIMPTIKKRILPESMVYTDEFNAYDRLKKRGYKHERVRHGAKVWVVGNAHTNTIEGFWSLLKRGINGVYHAVSEKHLQSYINEYSFRYNHRGDNKPMFRTILERV